MFFEKKQWFLSFLFELSCKQWPPLRQAAYLPVNKTVLSTLQPSRFLSANILDYLGGFIQHVDEFLWRCALLGVLSAFLVSKEVTSYQQAFQCGRSGAIIRLEFDKWHRLERIILSSRRRHYLAKEILEGFELGLGMFRFLVLLR